MKRTLAALGVVVVLLLWKIPATFVDSGLGLASSGTLRVTQATGTVWSGRGVLMGLDFVTDGWQPWMAVEWTLSGATLLRGSLSWVITSGLIPVARMSIGYGGIEFSEFHLRGPARFLIGAIPHNIARAGWRGDVVIESPRFRCSWRARCDGHAELRWIGAVSELLPGEALGDYQLAIDGSPGGEILFHVQTLDGPIRVDGEGRWKADESLTFDGTIKGKAGLLQRLPSIAGPWVSPSAEPGTWNVAIRREPG